MASGESSLYLWPELPHLCCLGAGFCLREQPKVRQVELGRLDSSLNEKVDSSDCILFRGIHAIHRISRHNALANPAGRYSILKPYAFGTETGGPLSQVVQQRPAVVNPLRALLRSRAPTVPCALSRTSFDQPPHELDRPFRNRWTMAVCQVPPARDFAYLFQVA